MPLILRAVKGSKLSIPEMDGNLTYLSSTLSGSIIQVTGSSINASNTIISASNLFIDNNVDTQNRVLYDSSNTLSVNWEDYTLNNSTGVILDWGDYTLIDSNTIYSVDWANRILYDSTGDSSIDWENRILKDASSNSVIEWNGITLQPSSDDSISLGGSSNRWRNTYVSRNLYVGAVNNESILTEGGLKLPTQSAAPVTTPTHGNGTIAVGKNAGSYFIYVYLDNQWRSASLS